MDLNKDRGVELLNMLVKSDKAFQSKFNSLKQKERESFMAFVGHDSETRMMACHTFSELSFVSKEKVCCMMLEYSAFIRKNKGLIS